MSSLPSVSIFGLGIIGSRCADRLEQEGYDLVRWNRSAARHPKQVSNIEDAAKSNVLCLYLKDGEACRAVAAAILHKIPSGNTLMNHSTVDLETTLWLAEQCENRGIHFLDCPFTGSKDASAAGALVYYVGGKLEYLKAHEELLLKTSKKILHIGEVGQATVVKISTNLISASTIQAVSEAMAISSAHGVAAETFRQCVSLNACSSNLSEMKIPTMAEGKYEPHFSLDNMLKDSKFAIQLARNKGISVPGMSAVSKQMQSLSEQGHGNLDYSSLYKQYDR